MRDIQEGFVTRSFLRSVWALDYEAFKGSEEEKQLFERLLRWSESIDLKETSAESAFLEEFFHQTWGYVQAGQHGSQESFTLYPQFSIDGAGQKGGTGSADAALGVFTSAAGNLVPQVLCEFKDIKSALDAPQRRKGNNRSPAQQVLDYLSFARRGFFGNEPILPTWAIVTDMNEFRLYWSDRGKRQFLRFTIRPADLFQGAPLTGDNEEARFERFLFYRVFHADTLLVRGRSGRSQLIQFIEQQWVRERKLENDFYKEYRAYRQHLYLALLENNGIGTPRFPGTRGGLVRLAQKVLDRCIFIFYCEDMGRALGFPPQLLRDFLVNESNDPYYDPEGTTIWQRLVSLFRAMNDGSAFGDNQLNQFNGGLFAQDTELDALEIPNRVFCQQGQGQNEASLYSWPLTLLYLSASYNYASNWGEGLTRPPLVEAPEEPLQRPGETELDKSLGLYTLGRIFEQSITELEILEAEADGRTSLNKISKRKRDGVYYTPEWVVDFIVAEAIGSRLADLKTQCGWPRPGSTKLPNEQAVLEYEKELKSITVLDPACGSGAFLITALRYLFDEWMSLQELRKQVSKTYTARDGETDEVIREILRNNLYGVDINPASVEITKLALWLHTARGNKPLSSLDSHIRDGNSLIDSSFYDGLAPYSDEEQERINAFDWEEAFPQVFERGGFDVVVGNPPYVKLQNFRKVHADAAGFLKTNAAGDATYASTQTGNYDLYLPFIEKGIKLLNENGRLGYIAPNLWVMNDYGAGLRDCMMANRNLYGWIDFQSFQVFDDVTTYTALQFYSKTPNEHVKITFAPDGILDEQPWDEDNSSLRYGKLAFGDRWLMTTGADRKLIDKLYKKSRHLDDPRVTRNIFVGIQTSADSIYHLKRLAPGRYLCTPKGANGQAPYEVTLEDELMKPLVSGPEAKRYIDPATDTYLLFPYELSEKGPELFPVERMARDYPDAWAYLCSWERELRRREGGVFNDERWYRFGRSQNIDKQEIKKLIVAQTVPSLRLCADPVAELYLNNVRVNGIVPADNIGIWFLLGVLNAPVCNHVFRRTAKPKDGGWFEANKQFVEYLPIPKTSQSEQQAIAEIADSLQALHTRRRDVIAEISRRFQVVVFKSRPEAWLFPYLDTLDQLREHAPTRLEKDEKRRWAKTKYAQKLDACFAALGAHLTPGVAMDASFDNGELKFFVDGAAVIEKIFVADAEGLFILAQWKFLASTFSITAKTDGRKLANTLRKIGTSDNTAVVNQIISLQRDLEAIDVEIEHKEQSINNLVYNLYDLDDADIKLIEAH